MKVFACGFNVYGQFFGCPDLIVDNFLELDGEHYRHADALILGHSFNLQKTGNRVLYNGAKNRKTRANPKFEIADLARVACSETRLLFLDGAGRLFKTDLQEIDVVQPLPNTLAMEEGEKVIDIRTDSKITVAKTNFGRIFNVPSKLVDFARGNVIDFRVGREHCLLLDEGGRVYTFGSGSRGQLGHSTLEDLEEPQLVEALAGIPIKAIAAGGWHSCAISHTGDLYTWGWNGNGQLGLAKNPEQVTVSVMATPHVVDVPGDSQANVDNVACGNRHTVISTDSDSLYGCGWNKYRQLGISSDENVYQMHFLKSFKESKIVSLKCGTWNTAVICEPK